LLEDAAWKVTILGYQVVQIFWPREGYVHSALLLSEAG
jgi:hypothetical protein